jgi:glycosyltransferase involved in cell wall biosynthesis
VNKKVIILAHDFPPFDSVGAKRPASWFKKFKALGIEPLVITRQWSDKNINFLDTIKGSDNTYTLKERNSEGIIFRVPYLPDFKDRMILKYGMNRFVFLRKMISFVSLYFRFLFPIFDPTRNIYLAAEKYLKEEKCDFILATGEPFILFKYASQLSRKFKIPYIVDYRDGWTSNQSEQKRSLPEKMLSAFYKRQEQKYVKQAAFISAAAPAYAGDLKKTFPNKKIKVIYNGFEKEVLDSIGKVEQQSEVFEIAYAGVLYPYQQLETFLEGYQKFIEEHKPKTRLLFYGLSFYPSMVDRVKSFNEDLLPFLHFTERLPYPDLMRKLQESQIMLLLSNEHLNWLSAKVFDYLAVNRKIILVKNDFGILEKILKDSNGGEAFSDSEEVSRFLAKNYSDFLKQGKVTHHTQINHFYSREQQAACFADVIHNFKDFQTNEMRSVEDVDLSV